MATKTVGTSLTTSLVAIQWQPGGLNPTDLATINELIHGVTAVTSYKTSARVENGILYIPLRSFSSEYITLTPGDWIAVDASTGWPVVIPKAVMDASTAWTHSA